MRGYAQTVDTGRAAKAHPVELSDAEAFKLVEAALGQGLSKFGWFPRGAHSRVAFVETSDQKLVAKFGLEPGSFEKDRFAAEHLASEDVPVPKIRLIKEIGDGLWLCLSDHVHGVASDDVIRRQEAKAAMASVQEPLVALHSTRVEEISGYGEFDTTGHASSSSWNASLTEDFCPAAFYNDASIDAQLIERAWALVRELADQGPAQGYLIHGDFGSDNLLIRGDAVSAVLDWSSASVGDWAVDLAGCEKYPLPIYGDLRDAHERAGFDMSNLTGRINCYRLRGQIGLVHWIWERQQRNVESWQDLASAQADLQAGVRRVSAGSAY
jgi:aminoglycoside phosphotransferase (APT) family kinase protein